MEFLSVLSGGLGPVCLSMTENDGVTRWQFTANSISRRRRTRRQDIIKDIAKNSQTDTARESYCRFWQGAGRRLGEVISTAPGLSRADPQRLLAAEAFLSGSPSIMVENSATKAGPLLAHHQLCQTKFHRSAA